MSGFAKNMSREISAPRAVQALIGKGSSWARSGIAGHETHALVIGGGIALHLARAGWETMLVDRDELTAGSTWHAAGLLPLFDMGYATSHIHDRSVMLYARLEAKTGLNAGFTRCGNLRTAQTDARMDEYRLYSATTETVGIEHEFLTPADQGALAAGRHRGPEGCAVPPDRRLYQPRGRDAGHCAGRAHRAQDPGQRLQMDRRGMDRHLREDGREGRQPYPLGRAVRDPPTPPPVSTTMQRAASAAVAGGNMPRPRPRRSGVPPG